MLRICKQYRPIPFENAPTILVSIFLPFRYEGNGRESMRLTRREERGREDSAPKFLRTVPLRKCALTKGEFFQVVLSRPSCISTRTINPTTSLNFI